MDASTAATLAAIAAAIAATAAWANVWIGRRQWLASQQPHLRAQPVMSSSGQIEVHISNAGPGTALEPAWAIVYRGQWTGGWANPTLMFIDPQAR